MVISSERLIEFSSYSPMHFVFVLVLFVSIAWRATSVFSLINTSLIITAKTRKLLLIDLSAFLFKQCCFLYVNSEIFMFLTPSGNALVSA